MAANFDENVKPTPPGMRAYPVISKIQAGLVKRSCAHMSLATALPLSSAKTMPLTGPSFEIEGDSMLPEFRPGDRVLIDPEVSPRPGDFVAA
jgi:SOS-response transcriptional repressor LexA